MPHITGLYIALPAYNKTMVGDTVMSLLSLSQLLSKECINFVPKIMGCAEIAELRNLFITEWYFNHRGMSHLLFVDSDMHFSPYMVWDMICFDKPLTGCMYAKREFPIAVVGKCLNDTDTVDNIEKGHLKVEGCGAGVMLIKRPVIDKLLEKNPGLLDKSFMHSVAGVVRSMGLPGLLRPFQQLEFEGGGRLSEDLSFCRRWIDIGGEVWANVHHPVGHVGPHEWTIRYGEYLEEKKKEAMALTAAPPLKAVEAA